MISGASIAFAAILLIIPGFVTDFLGFVLLFPPTRKLIINSFLNSGNIVRKENKDFIEGEVLDKKKDDKDEI